MLSYQVYKVIHLWAVFIIIIGLLLGFTVKSPSKGTKIVIGIASLLIFVGGMGMMARLNIAHTGTWPIWLKLKVMLWFILVAVAPILMKRLIRFRMQSFYFFIGVIMLAAWIVINQGLFAS